MNGKRQQQQRRRAGNAARRKRAAARNRRIVHGLSAPVAQATQIRNTGPRISSSGANIVVTHMEPMSSIGFADQQIVAWSINPGSTLMFPWLSGVSAHYETYVFRRLEFHFQPRLPSTATGTILWAVDFDPKDTSPTSEVQLLSYRGAQENSIWKRCSMKCNPADLHKRRTYYVKEQDDGTNLDNDRSSSVGTFYFQTSGVGTSPSGRFYASYTIELQTPQLAASVNQTWGGNMQHDYESNKVKSMITLATGSSINASAFDDAGIKVIPGPVNGMAGEGQPENLLQFEKTGLYKMEVNSVISDLTGVTPGAELLTVKPSIYDMSPGANSVTPVFHGNLSGHGRVDDDTPGGGPLNKLSSVTKYFKVVEPLAKIAIRGLTAQSGAHAFATTNVNPRITRMGRAGFNPVLALADFYTAAGHSHAIGPVGSLPSAVI